MTIKSQNQDEMLQLPDKDSKASTIKTPQRAIMNMLETNVKI